MGRECVIIFATITSEDITARADKDTFSMTTKDPAQVRAMQTAAQEACSSELIKVSQKLSSEVQCEELGTLCLTAYWCL